MDTAKFDDILMGILQHCEHVEPFLDAMFSFLARRTDFFQVMHDRNDKMGFPPGVAEKIVLKIFKNYQQIIAGSRMSKTSLEKKSESRTPKPKDTVSSVSTSAKSASPEVVMATDSAVVPPATTSVEVETSPSTEQTEPQQSEARAEASCSADTSTASSSNPASSSQTKEDENTSESKGLIPGKTADCYNGAVLDNYSWSQTIKDIEVKIPVPSSITKGRDVGVEIKSSHLKVWLKKGASPETGSNVIIDGKLQWPVKCEDSMWLLEGGKHIVVNLDKVQERFWTAVLDGDAEIDKTKVDTTRDISDFDEQTQSDFQHVMYDHHQKLQGKPTSQELKTHELLKKAWDAKGSPFAGTEFDPSKVNISPSYG